MGNFKSLIRWASMGGAVAVLAAVAYVAIRPRPIDVDLARVVRGSMQVTVNEDGRTRIRERYVVSAPLTGRLLRLELDPGDPVIQGQTKLAVITPRDPGLLDARELRQAEMRVKAEETELLRTTPDLESAKAALAYAETELARMRTLVPTGAATDEALDRAEMAYRVSREDYRAAVMAQQIASFELELARAALVRTRDDDHGDVSDFEIESPIDGRILRVLQESSTVVDPGTPLVEVGDPADLEVVVDVLSVDAVRIRPGAVAYLERWGGDRRLEGRVRLVEPSAFTKVSSLGVEEQRVNVLIDISDPPQERASLGDGFRVEARIVTWEGDSVVQVPTAALFRVADAWAVFVADSQMARLRTVSIGHQNDVAAEVLDGLAEGEPVILHPSDKIDDGTQIVRRAGTSMN